MPGNKPHPPKGACPSHELALFLCPPTSSLACPASSAAVVGEIVPQARSGRGADICVYRESRTSDILTPKPRKRTAPAKPLILCVTTARPSSASRAKRGTLNGNSPARECTSSRDSKL